MHVRAYTSGEPIRHSTHRLSLLLPSYVESEQRRCRVFCAPRFVRILILCLWVKFSDLTFDPEENETHKGGARAIASYPFEQQQQKLQHSHAWCRAALLGLYTLDE